MIIKTRYLLAWEFSMTNIKLLFLASIVLFNINAHALFLISPYAGYSSLNTKITDLANTTADIKLDSPIYGLGLNYLTPGGVFLGVNGSYVDGKGKVTVNSIGTDIDINHTTASAQLGLVVMNSMKIYLGYLVKNDLNIKSNTSDSLLTGPGYQAGIELLINRFSSLAVNYDLQQFDKIKNNTTGQTDSISSVYSKIDSQTISGQLKFYF